MAKFKYYNGSGWVELLSDAGSSPNLNDGSIITQPAGANALSIKTHGTASDTGIFYLSDDASYVCNSGDAGYVFSVFDKDMTTDFSSSSTASLSVLQGGQGTYIRGSLSVDSDISNGGKIWLTGSNNRLTTTSGMPGNMQYTSNNRGTQIYANGIAFADPYNGGNANDAAWLRHLETTTNTSIFEIATGDDADGSEEIRFRWYNTSNNIQNDLLVPKKTGTLAVQGDNISVFNNDSGYITSASIPSSFSQINNRYDTLLNFSGDAPNLVGNVSPVGMAMSNEHSANRLAFINANALYCEYSTDGTNWAEQTYMDDNAKVAMVTKSYGMPVGRNNTGDYEVNSKTRLTISGTNAGGTQYLYCSPKKMLINISSSGGMDVLIECRTGANTVNNGSWQTYGTYSLSGWSGWNEIPLVMGTLGGYSTQYDNFWQLRLTFTMTSKNTSYPTTAYVNAIRLYADNIWYGSSNMATINDLYDFDMGQNAYFPNNIYEAGTALVNKYASISALNGYMPLSGNSTKNGYIDIEYSSIPGNMPALSINYDNNNGGANLGDNGLNMIKFGTIDNYIGQIPANKSHLGVSTFGLHTDSSHGFEFITSGWTWLATLSPSGVFNAKGGLQVNGTNVALTSDLSGYLQLSGGTTPVSFNSTNLPQFSGSPQYLVGIEAFADGGTLKWQSASSVSVGNADTVDNEHASAFAHRGQNNDLIASGNEFNFVPGSYSPNTVWFNYRTADGGFTATGITTYTLGDGKGGALGNIIHTGNIGSQSVNYASSSGNANYANSAGAVAWGNVSSKPNLITVYRSQSISTATNDYWASMVNHTDSGSPTTPSNDSKWWHILSMDWAGNDPYNWYSQLALPTQDGGVPHYRRNDSGGTNIDSSTWHSFITDENISSQSVNYATSAGSASSATTATSATSAGSATVADNVSYIDARSNTSNLPSSANTSGQLKFVLCASEPSTKYDGYVYLILS